MSFNYNSQPVPNQQPPRGYWPTTGTSNGQPGQQPGPALNQIQPSGRPQQSQAPPANFPGQYQKSAAPILQGQSAPQQMPTQYPQQSYGQPVNSNQASDPRSKSGWNEYFSKSGSDGASLPSQPYPQSNSTSQLPYHSSNIPSQAYQAQSGVQQSFPPSNVAPQSYSTTPNPSQSYASNPPMQGQSRPIYTNPTSQVAPARGVPPGQYSTSNTQQQYLNSNGQTQALQGQPHSLQGQSQALQAQQTQGQGQYRGPSNQPVANSTQYASNPQQQYGGGGLSHMQPSQQQYANSNPRPSGASNAYDPFAEPSPQRPQYNTPNNIPVNVIANNPQINNQYQSQLSNDSRYNPQAQGIVQATPQQGNIGASYGAGNQFQGLEYSGVNTSGYNPSGSQQYSQTTTQQSNYQDGRYQQQSTPSGNIPFPISGVTNQAFNAYGPQATNQPQNIAPQQWQQGRPNPSASEVSLNSQPIQSDRFNSHQQTHSQGPNFYPSNNAGQGPTPNLNYLPQGQAVKPQSGISVTASNYSAAVPSIENFAVPSISALASTAVAQAASANSNRPSRWGAANSAPTAASASNASVPHRENWKSSGKSNFDQPPSSAASSLGKYGPSASTSSVSASNQRQDKDHGSKYASKDDNRGTKNTSHSSRGRSRSRSSSKGRSSGSKRRAASRSKSPPARNTVPNRQTQSSTNTPTSSKKIDYATMLLSQLTRDFNCPAIGRNTQSLGVPDLTTRFPDMYIPSDFVRVDVDWNSIHHVSQQGTLSDLTKTVSVMFESNPPTLHNDSTYAPYASLVEPPKFSYITPSTPFSNQQAASAAVLASASLQSSRLSASLKGAYDALIKPIKFNVRVIVTLGFRSGGDKVDSKLHKNLRVLVAKKKGNIMLLGGPWCRELDGGDPLVDRSCLENTARRTVLSQSLLDVSYKQTCTLSKVAEIVYHRPKEEFKGKEYPEQDDVTVLYLCAVQTPSEDIFNSTESTSDFDFAWNTFSKRISGKGVGPTMDLYDIDADCSQQTEQPVANDSVVASDPPVVTSNEQSNELVNNVQSDIIESQKESDEAVGGESLESQENDAKSDDESSNVQYIKTDEKIFINEDSALGLIVQIIRDHGNIVDDNDEEDLLVKSLSISRDKILRELKSVRGDSWTNIYKPTCGAFPAFLALHSAIVTISGTTVTISSETNSSIEVISSSEYALKTNPQSSNHMTASRSDNSAKTERIDGVEVKHEVIPPVMNKSAQSVSVRTKPNTPCVFLCPTPLPKDYASDSQRRNEAITLRILPLFSVLTYTKEDSNERVFEASIAAEILRSCISVHYANIIADVLLSKSENGYYTADPRVYLAVRQLSGQPIIQSSEMNIESDAEAKDGESDEHASKKLKSEDTMEAKDSTVDEKTDNTDDDYIQAKTWKELFLSACRYYDISQVGFIRYDTLHMILQNAARDITRADMTAMAWNNCKDECFRYEQFL